MKNLRVLISDEKSHRFATYWIAACIGVHAFAMQCEAEERGDPEGREEFDDNFIEEGMGVESDSEANAADAPHSTNIRLAQAKLRRESLKRRLFRAKDNRRAQRTQRFDDMINN